MLKFFCSLFFISLFGFSLYASGNTSYDKAFKEMNSKPISQLDFKIHQLNDEIKKFKKHNSFDFGGGYIETYKICDKVYCYKDPTNSKIVVCEVISGISKITESKNKIKKIKFIYETILDLAKATIHPSFNQSNLRVIIKREKLVNLIIDQIPEEDFEDFALSYIPQKPETLVIWENGIPQYQEAFFAN